MNTPDFSVILPNIRSCHNVGSIFRSADACGVDMLYLVGYTAAPPKVQIDKVSLGAEKWVPFEQHTSLKELISELKAQGVSIVALEKTDASIDIAEGIFDRPMALILGNEVDGIDKSVLEVCDQVIHIPMYGKKESLNVSVAAGIAMYEIRKHISQTT